MSRLFSDAGAADALGGRLIVDGVDVTDEPSASDGREGSVQATFVRPAEVIQFGPFELSALVPVAAAVIGGSIAGVIAGGLGSRVAMRISGAMTDPALIGVATTANGNRVGEVTVGGTFGLIFFGGFIAGLFGGGLYALVRPWLAGLGRWRGVAFGALLYLAFGALVVEGDNFDFRRFGSPPLNVAMFIALFPLFGVIAVPLIDRLDRSLAPGRANDLRQILAIAAAFSLALLLLPALVLLGAIISNLFEGATIERAIAMEQGSAFMLGFLGVPAVLLALRWTLTWGGHRFERPADAADRPVVLAATYLMLAALVAAGAARTVEALLELLS